MPTLPISNGSGGLKQWAYRDVLAVLFFPRERSSKERERWLAVLRTQEKVYASERGLVPPDGFDWSDLERVVDLERLGELSQSPEGAYNKGVDRLIPGLLVGKMLTFQLSCAVHHPEFAGVGPARRALSKTLKGKRTFDCKQVPVSDGSLRHAWPDFKPAAHLWAAWSAWDKILQPKDSAQPLRNWYSYPECEQLRYLALSEDLRRKAESRKILDPAKTWKVPEDLVLPDETLSILPLSEDLLDRLEEWPGDVQEKLDGLRYRPGS